MDRTVSWPVVPDELTITMLFTIKEEKMQKRNGLCHARGAYSSNCFLKRFGKQSAT